MRVRFLQCLRLLCVLFLPVSAAATITVEPDLLATPAEYPFAEVHLAAHPTDPDALIFSVIAFSREDTSGLNTRAAGTTYHTRDGGRTWTESRIPLQQEHGGYNARVAFTPDGTALFTAIQSSLYRQHLYRSTDGGATWNGPQDLGRGGDYPVMSVDPRTGRIFITVTNNEDFPPSASRQRLWISDEKGEAFAPDFVAMRSDPETTGNWGLLGRSGANTVFSDGTLFLPVVDMAHDSTFWNTFVQVSPDGDVLGPPRRFLGRKQPAHVPTEPGKVISPSGSTDQAIAYAMDAKTDRLYAVFTDRSSSPGRIRFTTSGDRGRTWTKPASISSANPLAEQYQGNIAVNKDGVIGIVWFSTGDHPQNDAFDVYFAASYDEGRSFTAKTKVNSASSRPVEWTGGGYDSGRHLVGGDYIGLVAAADGVFHAAWPDARSGLFQVYTTRITADSDRSGTEPLAKGDRAAPMITSVPLMPAGFRGTEVEFEAFESIGRPFDAMPADADPTVARLSVHEDKLYAAASGGSGAAVAAVPLETARAAQKASEVQAEWVPEEATDRALATRLRPPAGPLHLPATDPRFEIGTHVSFNDALVGAVVSAPRDGEPSLIALSGLDSVAPVVLPRPDATVVDLTVAERSLWALTSDAEGERFINRLYASTDAVVWDEVGSFYSELAARSVAVAPRNLYFGMGDEILRLRRALVEVLPVPGQAQLVVVPDEFAQSVTPASTTPVIGTPLGNNGEGWRTQTLLDGVHFAGVKAPQWLTGLAWRPAKHERADQPYTNSVRGLKVRSSILRGGVPPGLAERFASNVSGVQAELFAGDFTYATRFSGGFEVQMDFTGGMLYDPARGALMLDIEADGSEKQVYFDMARGREYRVQRGTHNVSEERAFMLDYSAAVMQFSTVPQPQLSTFPQVTVSADAESQVGVPLPLAGKGDPDLTYRWVQASGPETVAFADVSKPTTAVTFPAVGTYTVRLVASDGQRTGADELTVTVIPAAAQ